MRKMLRQMKEDYLLWRELNETYPVSWRDFLGMLRGKKVEPHETR